MAAPGAARRKDDIGPRPRPRPCQHL